jgi:murein DD-endopeptidase MepM/ murein hydrolase activator NlpD
VLLIVVVMFSALAAFLWLRTRQTAENGHSDLRNAGTPSGSVLEQPTPAATPTLTAAPTESPTPTATPSIAGLDSAATPATDGSQTPKAAPIADSFVGTLKLIVPVVGVRPDQLMDTFADARSEGRVHDAIDIPAPAGTQVVAAADGEIVKLFPSERGGTTIYQLSVDKKLVFYYAHLQRYADGLAAGKFVHQGEVIGYVGDTGNAGAGNFHLHFSISVISDPKRYWEGTNINPYPLLHK